MVIIWFPFPSFWRKNATPFIAKFEDSVAQEVNIISVGSAHEKHCLELAEKFKNESIRAEVDITNETVGNKIRKAVKEKIPYMLVIGDIEMNSTDLKVRVRGQEKLLEISYDKFVEMLKSNIKEKSLIL